MPFQRALALSFIATCLSAGCFYSFDNPVEQHDDGVILGQCQLASPVAGQTTQGGSAALLFSALQIPLDSNGKFLFFDLPNGNYALKCAIPPATASDFALIAERPDVVLPKTPSQVSDSIDLGALSISATGVVSGTVSGALGPVVVASFTPAADGGLGGYEAISAAADPTTGAFQIALPPGNHILAAADPAQSATAAVVVQAGTTQSQSFALVPPPASQTASLDGLLVLDGPSLGAAADPGTLATLLGFVTVTVTDPTGNVLSQGPFTAPDGGSLDGHFHLPLPVDSSSVTLTFTLSAGASFQDPGDHLSTFVLSGLPVIPGQATQLLPQVTWIDDGDLAANVSDAGGDGGVDAGADGGTDGGWALAAGPFSIPDAGIYEMALAPLGGGLRFIAAAGTPLTGPDPGLGDLWVGQQSSTGLRNVQWLTDGGGFFQDSLSMATDDSGNALVAWGSSFGNNDTYTTDLGLALVQADGGVVWPSRAAGLNPEITYFGQATTTFTGQLGAESGFFSVMPDLTPGVFDAVFIGPAQAANQSPAPVLNLVTDAGFTGAINVVGVSCALPELAGQAGFCLAASEFDSVGALHGVLMGVATADGGATVVSLADLGALPLGGLDGVSSAGIGLTTSPAGKLLATFDPQELGGDGNSYSTTLVVAGPFTTLVTPPAVAALTVPYTVTLLLPDPAGFLAVGGVTADSISGVGAMLFALDGGLVGGVDGGFAAPTVLPSLSAASSGSPETISAYRDPDSGVPTLPAELTSGALSILQLDGVP